MDDKVKSSLIGASGGLLSGGINALYASALQRQQIQLEKDWWYEQQKFLEQHNSPAYQSMKMRQAGLNAFQNVSPQSLGSVGSELPRRPNQLFNTADLTALMQTLGNLNVQDAQAQNYNADSELKGAQTLTEGQRYQQLIQEWFYNEILYNIGLLTEEEKQIKLNELRKAAEDGNYTPTSDAARAADDEHAESVGRQTEQGIVNENLAQFYADRHSLNEKTIEDLSSRITNRALRTELERQLTELNVKLKDQEFQYKEKVNPLLEEAQRLANEVTQATRDNIITDEQGKEIANAIKDLEYRIQSGTASFKEIMFYYAKDIANILNDNVQGALDRNHESDENLKKRQASLVERLLSIVDI